MRTIFKNTMFMLCGCIGLSACNHPGTKPGTAATTLAPAGSPALAPVPPMTPPAPATAPAVSAPYSISAHSSGPYIDFSIENHGTADLVVKKEDFAVITPENREVTPYTKNTAVIDLPQAATVSPGSVINGRAIFKQVNSPVGKRLVYRPDSNGAFAVITSPMLPK